MNFQNHYLSRCRVMYTSSKFRKSYTPPAIRIRVKTLHKYLIKFETDSRHVNCDRERLFDEKSEVKKKSRWALSYQ
jgi:hypothetical protein